MYLSIDENGLGPVLGPLLVTGVCGTRDPSDGWPGFIRDSKILFSRTDKGFSEIESVSLALFYHVFGFLPEDSSQLFATIGDSRCLLDGVSICRDNLPSLFSWAGRDVVDGTIETLSSYFDRAGIRIAGLTCEVLCVRRFNEMCGMGMRKDFIDYLQFEKIILLWAGRYQDLVVRAGKIGGRKAYGGFFASGRLLREEERIIETDNVSLYIARAGDRRMHVHFMRNIEESSFLAVLAGIFGKYIRELIMAGINISLGNGDHVSGYRDPKTKEFIRKLQEGETVFRKECLLRIK